MISIIANADSDIVDNTRSKINFFLLPDPPAQETKHWGREEDIVGEINLFFLLNLSNVHKLYLMHQMSKSYIPSEQKQKQQNKEAT